MQSLQRFWSVSYELWTLYSPSTLCLLRQEGQVLTLSKQTCQVAGCLLGNLVQMVLLIKGNFLSNWQNEYLSADMVLTGTPHHPYRQDGAATQSYQQRWAEGTFLPREWLLESGEIAVKGPSRGAMILHGGAKPPPAMGLTGRALRQNHNLSLFSCSNVLLPSHPGQSPKKARGQEGLSLDFNLS